MQKITSLFLVSLLVLLWSSFASANLIPNADFSLMDGDSPVGWVHGECSVPGVTKSHFGVGSAPRRNGRFLRITGGDDRAGTWSCTVAGIEASTDYVFSVEIVRKRAVNRMYPRVTVLGHSFLLDQVWFPKYDHKVRLTVNSGDISGEGTVVLENGFPTSFWFRNPCLEKKGIGQRNTRNMRKEERKTTNEKLETAFTAKGAKGREGKNRETGEWEAGDGKAKVGGLFLKPKTCDLKPFFTAKGREGGSGRSEVGGRFLKPKTCDLKPSFPLGLYGTSVEDLGDIAASPFNLVSVGSTVSGVVRAHWAGLSCFVRMPHDGAKLAGVAEKFRAAGVGFGPKDRFYIDDEPELRSVDPLMLRNHREHLHALWPDTPGIMANVRPQCVADYRDASDVFMMDQYPIPSMPMTWLSDSMDEARELAGDGKEIWAIIQAFGGEKMARHGWPEFPSYEQMRCLTTLALIHGARGILYYTYSSIKKQPEGWRDVCDLGLQIRSMEPWLLSGSPVLRLPVTMTSPFQSDAQGRPALQVGMISNAGRTLILAVNVTDRPVTGLIRGLPQGLDAVHAPFDNAATVVRKGTVQASFAPWQVRVWVAGDNSGIRFRGFRQTPPSWMETAMAEAVGRASGPWF